MHFRCLLRADFVSRHLAATLLHFVYDALHPYLGIVYRPQLMISFRNCHEIRRWVTRTFVYLSMTVGRA